MVSKSSPPQESFFPYYPEMGFPNKSGRPAERPEIEMFIFYEFIISNRAQVMLDVSMS
jgi:hypothetical protein